MIGHSLATRTCARSQSMLGPPGGAEQPYQAMLEVLEKGVPVRGGAGTVHELPSGSVGDGRLADLSSRLASCPHQMDVTIF
jgi:hypothetical protein